MVEETPQSDSEVKKEDIKKLDEGIAHAKSESNLPKLKELVERGEVVTKNLAEQLKKQEELLATKLIGGESDAGEQAEKKEKEETPLEYAKRLIGGG